MRSDGEGRFCERCQLRVTEVAKLDGEHLEQLVEAGASERVCVRFELDHGRPRTVLGIAAGLMVVALAGCATPMPESSNPPLEMAALPKPAAGSGGAIAGSIQHEGIAGAGAIVILQSTALPSQLEAITDERGIYSFEGLPPGNYTIQVLWGKANTSKIVQLPTDGRFRANFSVNPEQSQEFFVGMIVESPIIDISSPASTYHSSMIEYD
jgi:hypothetical protein